MYRLNFEKNEFVYIRPIFE